MRLRGAACRYRRRTKLSRSEEHTSELQSHSDLVCRLLLEKKKHTVHASVPPFWKNGHTAEPGFRLVASVANRWSIPARFWVRWWLLNGPGRGRMRKVGRVV